MSNFIRKILIIAGSISYWHEKCKFCSVKTYIEKYPIYTQVTIQVLDYNLSVKPINKHSGTKIFRHDG